MENWELSFENRILGLSKRKKNSTECRVTLRAILRVNLRVKT